MPLAKSTRAWAVMMRAALVWAEPTHRNAGLDLVLHTVPRWDFGPPLVASSHGGSTFVAVLRRSSAKGRYFAGSHLHSRSEEVAVTRKILPCAVLFIVLAICNDSFTSRVSAKSSGAGTAESVTWPGTLGGR